MTTKHKKILGMTHEKGLGLLEDMNMLMFGFGPDAEFYKKRWRKRGQKEMCEWFMKLIGRKPKKKEWNKGEEDA